jgi:Cys-tRNA(Pro) deacylase
MKSEEYPVTSAVRALRAAGIPIRPRFYEYEEHGGTAVAARELGVPEHQVIKTLVMEADGGKPVIVLMHGDCEVSTKNLARTLGVKKVGACSPETAHRHTGYTVGGISPFGTRNRIPVCVEKSIYGSSAVFINGGKRGFLLELEPAELPRLLAESREVEVAIPHGNVAD